LAAGFGMVAIAVYIAIETRCFEQHGERTRLRSFGNALRAYVESQIIVTAISMVFNA
jgi:hypothetical protein